VIVVATADFEVYHGVVTELRDRGVEFTTVEPGDPLPEAADVLVVGPDDDAGEATDRPGATVEPVRADPEEPRRAVEEALAVLRGGEGRTVVGVDPGGRPGIAVLNGDIVTAVFQVPVDQAVDLVRREVADAVDPVVRVGDGARLQSARIVDALDDGRVELVDETGTTPYQGTGVRGAGDVVAAVNIARLEGDPVDERDVEPTAGELKRIKQRSRERSDADRTLTDELARRVAVGDLTMAEALDEHREE
jgi:membrane-associated protease RseP (regulator of RpoE activity)